MEPPIVRYLSLFFDPDDDIDITDQKQMDSRALHVAEHVFINSVDDKAIEAELRRALGNWADDELVGRLIAGDGIDWLSSRELRDAFRFIVARVAEYIQIRRQTGPLLPHAD